VGALDFLRNVYSIFGFTFNLRLSTRPEKYLGELEVSWSSWSVKIVSIYRYFPLLFLEEEEEKIEKCTALGLLHQNTFFKIWTRLSKNEKVWWENFCPNWDPNPASPGWEAELLQLQLLYLDWKCRTKDSLLVSGLNKVSIMRLMAGATIGV
jgi:hypothetical protein